MLFVNNARGGNSSGNGRVVTTSTVNLTNTNDYVEVVQIGVLTKICSAATTSLEISVGYGQ